MHSFFFSPCFQGKNPIFNGSRQFRTSKSGNYTTPKTKSAALQTKFLPPRFLLQLLFGAL